MWYYLFSGLLSLIAFTCSDAIHSKPEEMSLSLPKEEAGSNFIDTAANNIHVIIEQAGMYGYEGQNINNAQKYSLENLRPWLLTMKSKFGNKMKVVIKTSPGASYKQIIDVLDEMSINEIKDYILIESKPAKTITVDPGKD